MQGAAISTVVLHDTSLSTANCSEKHFVVGGHHYCHIMDPRTLRPVEGRLQATVIAPSATDSDALSNAMFVLDGRERGRVMRSLPGTDAALVVLAGGTAERSIGGDLRPVVADGALSDGGLQVASRLGMDIPS